MKKIYKYINEEKLKIEIENSNRKILITQWKDDILELEHNSNISTIVIPYLENDNLTSFAVQACLEDLFLELTDKNINRFLTSKFNLKQ